MTLPLEPDQLDPEEVREVEGMLEAVDLDELSRRPQRRGGPDRFTYELEVERPGRRRALSFSEEDVPEGLKPALQRLTELAIEKRRRK